MLDSNLNTACVSNWGCRHLNNSRYACFMSLSFIQLPKYSHQIRQGMSVYVIPCVYAYISRKHSLCVPTYLRSVVHFLLSPIFPPALLPPLCHSCYSCLTFYFQLRLNFRCGLLFPSSIWGHGEDIIESGLWCCGKVKHWVVLVQPTGPGRPDLFLLNITCYKGRINHQVE